MAKSLKPFDVKNTVELSIHPELMSEKGGFIVFRVMPKGKTFVEFSSNGKIKTLLSEEQFELLKSGKNYYFTISKRKFVKHFPNAYI